MRVTTSTVTSHTWLTPGQTGFGSVMLGSLGTPSMGKGWEVLVAEAWMSADDIAAHLGITKDTVYTWIADRGMPAHKIGRIWKFQASEVDDWVRRGDSDSAQEHPETS
ncbi:helix-turn-helix domain-containing protein [Actinomycetaceae bacterium MB13-C1-2]|nr:helix-turn-helix domain-containing protein [Actinomycetaceae bacterium MB13-C1-2]